MTELVDVIDPETGAVLDTVSRGEIRDRNHWHRAVFVVVLGPQDELVTHRRAGWKDMWPDRWDLAFGGVVDAGEVIDDAARRELAEEAGVRGATLEHLGAGTYVDERVREIGDVYLTYWDGPIVPTDGEVAELGTVGVGDLAGWLATHDVVPDSVEIVVPLLRDRLTRGGVPS